MQYTKKPASQVVADMRACVWTLESNPVPVYHTRVPLWGQRWHWHRDWIMQAAAHNTIPAMILRGAAVIAAWAFVMGLIAGYGAVLTLWVMGVI